MPRERPAWESEPSQLRVGRRFIVSWLIGNQQDVGCFLYELHEDRGDGLASEYPVYVGITRDFPARWGEHRRGSWWFEHAHPRTVILSGYSSRADARKVEAVRLDESRPRFNTKPERRHLRLAQLEPPALPLFTAELHLRSVA